MDHYRTSIRAAGKPEHQEMPPSGYVGMVGYTPFPAKYELTAWAPHSCPCCWLNRKLGQLWCWLRRRPSTELLFVPEGK